MLLLFDDAQRHKLLSGSDTRNIMMFRQVCEIIVKISHPILV